MRVQVAASLLAIVSLMGAMSSVASANSQTGGDNGSQSIPQTTIDTHQIEIMQEEFGISETDARNRLIHQTEIGTLIDQASDLGGERFVAGWVTHTPEWMVYIRLTQGEEIPEISKLANQAPFPVEILYDSLYSNQELQELGAELSTKYHDVAGVDGIYVDRESMNVAIVTNPFVSRETVEDFEQGSTLDLLPHDNSLPDLSIEVETLSEAAGLSYLGGVKLSTCTAGFVVTGKDSTGRTRLGIATAGHCGNIQEYALTPNGTPSTRAYLVREYFGAYGDVQWHTTPHPDHTNLPRFFGRSATSHVPVLATGNAYVGLQLCHRGRATGYSCGFVDSTNYAPTYSGGCGGQVCQPVFVHVSGGGVKNAGGDSGGPWFYQNTAYGIHSGGTSNTGIFTPLSRLVNVGASIVKQ